jgi:folate-binding protein YgfZ
MASFTASLPERGVVEVDGADRVTFLQGLVSNDVEQAAPGRAVWAALLTPQGKWLADFFILVEGDRLLLDCERGQAPMLAQRLSRYRLRARVGVRDASAEFAVFATWGNGPPTASGTVAPDPRVAGAGWRVLAREPVATNADWADWDRFRLQLGLPDGTRDLEPEKSILLEAGFDELGGVSWTKGCYMGQELTARTRYRGLVKRRLVPVDVPGVAPPPGTPILRDGAEVGIMRSECGGHGLALLRLDALGGPLRCGDAVLTVRLPPWLRLAETAEKPKPADQASLTT